MTTPVDRIPFAALVPGADYLPLSAFGLIGDCASAALVGRDGAVRWLCLPRFDSAPVFAAMLDPGRGLLRLEMEGAVEARQYYLPDTAVLVTEMRGPDGAVRVTDAMTLRSGADLRAPVAPGRGELLRRLDVLHGHPVVRLRAELPDAAWRVAESGWLRARPRPDLTLALSASLPLRGTAGRWTLKPGQRLHVSLCWGRGAGLAGQPGAAAIDETAAVWRRWLAHCALAGPEEAMVRRSLITLKLLDHAESGASVAAPTSSLPELIGGGRNWDYRYTWIRDGAFAAAAFAQAGYAEEGRHFHQWLLRAVRRWGPKVLYAVDGGMPPPEREDAALRGYLGSRPVRWGNGAAGQTQHDAFGEILDSAWLHGGNRPSAEDWALLTGLADQAEAHWSVPDHGIWEVRTDGRPFTYSAALCQVALDRGARLAARFGLPGDAAGWTRTARAIQERILTDAWNEPMQSLTAQLGGGDLDASLLALPLRGVLPADHPRMTRTVAAIRRRLAAGDGLLYRYHAGAFEDGLAGREGAFLLCSFWLVDNLVLQGRLDEAQELFASLCARGGPLGLLPEEICPDTGLFLGNYPQAFSHIGVINSAARLARALAR